MKLYPKIAKIQFQIYKSVFSINSTPFKFNKFSVLVKSRLKAGHIPTTKNSSEYTGIIKQIRLLDQRLPMDLLATKEYDSSFMGRLLQLKSSALAIHVLMAAITSRLEITHEKFRY